MATTHLHALGSFCLSFNIIFEQDCPFSKVKAYLAAILVAMLVSMESPPPTERCVSDDQVKDRCLFCGFICVISISILLPRPSVV